MVISYFGYLVFFVVILRGSTVTLFLFFFACDNRPDIVLINRVKKEWLIVDFSVPSDVNVVGKEDEKIMRYSPLALDARKLHGVSTKVIPVVVGSFGVVSSRLAGFLRELGVGHTLGGTPNVCNYWHQHYP